MPASTMVGMPRVSAQRATDLTGDLAKEALSVQRAFGRVDQIGAAQQIVEIQMRPAFIAGLTGLGDRKSIQPMAARVDGLSNARSHHFIGASLWDSTPLEATLWSQTDALSRFSSAVSWNRAGGLPARDRHARPSAVS